MVPVAGNTQFCLLFCEATSFLTSHRLPGKGGNEAIERIVIMASQVTFYLFSSERHMQLLISI